MRIFPIDENLKNYRLHKIGIRENLLYISPDRNDSIEIWSIHTFVANSWTRIIHIPLIEKLFTSFAISQQQPIIYVLAVACFDCDIPRISIIEINADNRRSKTYNLDELCGEEFENNVFLENIVIQCGREKLFMYDRSIVMGPIPFWFITLLQDSMTFVIKNEQIYGKLKDDRCSRFPIVIDGDIRKILKIYDNHELVVYDGNKNCWNTYFPSPKSCINLNSLTARGIGETYGRNGHRVGAVESLLTIFIDEGICIAKIYRNNFHSFFYIKLNDEKREYVTEGASRCKLPFFIQQRFYGVCTKSQFVFICKNGIALLPLQPPTLKESAFLSIQQKYSNIIANKWFGGISEQQIKDLCFCTMERSLLL